MAPIPQESTQATPEETGGWTGGRPDHLEIGFESEQRLHAFPHQQVVVGEEHRNGRILGRRDAKRLPLSGTPSRGHVEVAPSGASVFCISRHPAVQGKEARL
jgi:hypothetical protein